MDLYKEGFLIKAESEKTMTYWINNQTFLKKVLGHFVQFVYNLKSRQNKLVQELDMIVVTSTQLQQQFDETKKKVFQLETGINGLQESVLTLLDL